ncbi:hypothetical protein Syun_017003 [Stephania yunnanensis]|uniref:Uncharacterized protein n=1 Tax=Stephania yunnanensis TaxID=152371 RepID=A0AAP0J8E6_9MAGN
MVTIYLRYELLSGLIGVCGYLIVARVRAGRQGFRPEPESAGLLSRLIDLLTGSRFVKNWDRHIGGPQDKHRDTKKRRRGTAGVLKRWKKAHEIIEVRKKIKLVCDGGHRADEDRQEEKTSDR